MAVRAAEGPAGAFSGRRLTLLIRAQTPKSASQKEETIQANRIANSARMTTSRGVKPSDCNTPAIWVTAATVEASTKNRYSQRRGAISGTTAGELDWHQLGRRGNHSLEERTGNAPWRPRHYRLGMHRTVTTQRDTCEILFNRRLKCARLGVHL